MANGYVAPLMRPHPFLFQHPLQRHLAAQQQRQYLYPSKQSSPNPHVYPSRLFAPPPTQNQVQCYFPNAFPEHGPNIFQRFWIRLFHFLMTPLYLLWNWSQHLYSAIKDTRLWETCTNADLLILFFYDNSWSLLIGLLVVVVLSVLAWFFSPKGENQTIWRSTFILTAASCYIMWAITFLAQWHPLIQPRMTKLRPGMPGMS